MKEGREGWRQAGRQAGSPETSTQLFLAQEHLLSPCEKRA